MRFILHPQSRPRTLFTAFRVTLAACFVIFFFAQPALAESNANATSLDLNLDIPTGPDAQPQPVYPDGPIKASDTAAERVDRPDTKKRRGPRPSTEELEAALSGDPEAEAPAREDQADIEAPIEPKTPIIVANIDKTTQEMTVFVDGVEEHRWPVSTGLPGYATPSGTFTTSSMNEIWYSRQWNNTPMPHAVFFTKEGHAVHATDQVSKLGRPASKGCVRLSPKNAKTFYNLVKEHGLERTEVVLSGSTPGGDYKMAHPDSDYDPYFDYGRPVYPRYAPYRDYRRYGYREIRPRAEQRRRAYQPRNQQRRYRRGPRRGNWFRAPGY